MLMRALALSLSLAAATVLPAGCKKDRSRPTPGAADDAATAAPVGGAANPGQPTAGTPATPGDGGAATAQATTPGDAGAAQSAQNGQNGTGAMTASKGTPPAGGDQGDKNGFDPNAKPENVKVLPKSWNMGKVVAFMKKDVSAGLGVKCKYCHVKPFSADTVKKKQPARKMIAMMFAINKQNFHGKQKVTCKTCHHGKARPPDIK